MANPDFNENDTRRARDIIRFCHADERNWMVEFHDGLPEKQTTTSHLTQADLMILDFHLDKEQPNDGTKAINILRELADNDYFNLVVVYTKGSDSVAGDIARIVGEIAVGLCKSDERVNLHPTALADVTKLVQQWEDDEPAIIERLTTEVDDRAFVKTRGLQGKAIDWKAACRLPELQGLKTLVSAAPEAVSASPKFKLITKWVLYRKQLELARRLAMKDFGTVRMDLGEDGTNWIRTDRLFVTVVSKSKDASSLPDHLVKALELWDPEPYRLLMAKMRAVLDKHGVLAEAEVLRNRHLQLGWLDDFLDAAADQRPWKFHNAIKRHWEGLGDAIRANVTEFGERLGSRLLAGEARRWYASLEPTEVTVHLNRYECSKEVEGSHLTTGHVLRIDNGGISGPYWLCLSPACDLEPGQKDSGWHKRLGEHIPFIAVELFELPAGRVEDALANATSANYLFLKIDENIKHFSFLPLPLGSLGGSTDRTPNPKWEQMFAEKQGRFDDNGNRLQIARAAGGTKGLEHTSYSATVVAQLRYEYALNLLQRLGASLSRVGLDFVPMNRRPPDNGQANP